MPTNSRPGGLKDWTRPVVLNKYLNSSRGRPETAALTGFKAVRLICSSLFRAFVLVNGGSTSDSRRSERKTVLAEGRQVYSAPTASVEGVLVEGVLVEGYRRADGCP